MFKRLLFGTALTVACASSSVAQQPSIVVKFACGANKIIPTLGPYERDVAMIRQGNRLSGQQVHFRHSEPKGDVLETFNGTVDQYGNLTMEVWGQYVATQKQEYYVSLHGSVPVANGPMVSSLGKLVRDCSMTLQ